MSVSTTTDPVQTVKDILDDTGNTDWSNAGMKPVHIEFQWNSTQKQKLNRARRGSDAVYIWSPAEGALESFAAQYNSYLDEQVVNADVWTTRSHNHCANLSGDIRNILNDYALDNKSKTKWNRIRPESENDVRQEKHPEKSDVYRIITLVRLHARRTASTTRQN